jgi:hypothetical protein
MSHEHPHDHSHPHPHPDTPLAEAQNAAAGEGAVMLDIGDGVGALVLYAAASAAGLEIDISPDGADHARTHVAVLPRPAGSSEPGHPPLHAAVYPTLAAGTWNLWHPDGEIALTVDIRDGEVTEARWES